MDEKLQAELIKKGRDFLHYDASGEEFVSDQMKKMPQPPLVKAPMRQEAIDLPTDFENLDMNNDFRSVINTRKSNRIYYGHRKESNPFVEKAMRLFVRFHQVEQDMVLKRI